MKNKNPIINELKNLNLIKLSKLIKISNSTRDFKNLKVYRDSINKIIFLEKYVSYLNKHNNYESEKPKNKKNTIKLLDKKTNSHNLEDDFRRFKQLEKYINKKDILDFGCGWGNFLKISKNAKKKYGIELRTQCVNYIKKNYKDIEIYNKIDQIKKKFDVITMFHVLEHIPHQVDTLKKIRNNLKKKGKIFIEVPSANDLLLDINLSNSFKNFTFWSEHLILHTEKSLTKILKAAGFKNIKIFFFQRYNFNNHINWFLMGKPGGHIYKKKFGDNKIIDEYTKFLKRKKKTDTLIAVAINK